MGNNPVNFSDPSGHCEVTGEDDSDYCHAPIKKLTNKTFGGGGNSGGSNGSGGNSGGGDDDNSILSPLPSGDACTQTYCEESHGRLLPFLPDFDDCGKIDLSGNCTGKIHMYRAFTFGMVIPPIYPIGWHVTISGDRFGNKYLGGGLDFGKSLLTGNVSFIDGFIDKNMMPADKFDRNAFMKNYMTGHSESHFISAIAYFGENYSISSQVRSYEEGAGSPEIGISWTFTIPEQ